MKLPLHPAVTVDAFTKRYGTGETEVTAVHHATFSVARGEVVALLGPSGSGKSTLLSAIGLINPPTSGRITIAGHLVMDGPAPCVDLRAFRRHHLGFVFQKANLIPFLTARQNVQIALEINDTPARTARARAAELLAGLGLAERLDHLPHMLSGGQQQRVAIARALANRPGLLLADEPTAALDGTLSRQVMGLFHQIAREHQSGVIVVTHDHRALDLFDRTLEMEDGHLRHANPLPVPHTP
ncbi:MAG: Macrolide export ATP-binding/permease protein MacB [Verrucomicrobiota bacterium]|jgi:putative ABC transport system ATP-binding protein